MDYSALLHDWIDGTLAPEHEEAVFIALSRQADLRSELQDLMRIRTAVRNDIAAFTPSPADTSAIFGRLGFTVPADIPSLATASASASTASSVSATSVSSGIASSGIASSGTSAAAGITAFDGAAKLAAGAAWKSYGAAIVSACLASLATIILLDWRSGNLFQSGSSNSFRQGNSTEMLPPSVSPASGESAGSGGIFGNGAGFGTSPYTAQGNGLPRYGVTTDTVRERIVIREVVRYVPMAADGRMIASASGNSLGSEQSSTVNNNSSFISQTLQSASPYNNANDNPLTKAFIKPSTTLYASSLSDNVLKSASELTSPILPEESFADVLHRFRLGVRGFTAWQIPQPTIEPSGVSLLNNAAISLHYALSPNHSVGIEAGQEAFFQKYQNVVNQDTYTVTQYPVQWWAGLTYRYNFMPNEVFSPYASATLGLAEYGFLGRTQFGYTYSPDGVTQFLLGAEASMLLYSNQGINYFAPKIGVTYGASLRW